MIQENIRFEAGTGGPIQKLRIEYSPVLPVLKSG